MLRGGGGAVPALEFTKEDNAAVRQLVTDFVAAYNSKDPAKTASFFAGSGVLMPPNSSTLRGEESIQGFFKERFAEGATELTFEVRDLNGVVTNAILTGLFSVRLVPPDGKPESRDRGKSLWIAEKLGGKWLFQYQVWSSDLPAVVCPPTDAEAEKAKAAEKK